MTCRALREMIGGYRHTALVALAAELGLADRIAQPRPIVDLATELAVDVSRLRTVLRAMAAVGLLRHEVDDAVALTEMGALLGTGHQAGQANAALYFGRVSAPAFEGLRAGLAGGEPPFDRAMGTAFYDFLEGRPARHDAYQQMIRVAGLGDRLAERYPFTGEGTLVDVGGGSGDVVTAVLRRHPDMKGVLLELESALAHQDWSQVEPSVRDRITEVAGSFFDDVPPGADYYVLARVLPNWGDDDALRILEHVRRAMRADATLLLVDLIMPAQVAEGSFVAIGDLQAMVHFGGGIRTAQELSELLLAAGLTVSGEHALDLGTATWVLTEAVAR